MPKTSGRDGRPGKLFENVEAADVTFLMSAFGDRMYMSFLFKGGIARARRHCMRYTASS